MEQAKRGVARIALVEDHSLILSGFRLLVEADSSLNLVFTADSLKDVDLPDAKLDLLVLDLRLHDGSVPALNVSNVLRHGVPVLLYSEMEDPAMVRAAMHAGALGAIRKSDPPQVLLDGIRAALDGEAVINSDIAAIIDGDEGLADANLSVREMEVLRLYADGATSHTVAHELGISRNSVLEYLRRIRHKYASVGRAADSRVELFARASQDRLLSADSSAARAERAC